MTCTLSAFSDEAGASIDDQIKALQRAGYGYTDLRGVGGTNIAVLPLDQAKETKKKLDDAGIKVGMFGSPLGKIQMDADFNIDLTKLRHLGELAPVLDCRRVRIFSYYNKSNHPKDAWKAESLKRLAALRDEAKKLGLKLYHENESNIYGDHPRQCAEIASLRDGKTFFMIFDFSNFNMGGDNVLEAWKLLKPHTDAFHLKDSNKEKQHVLLGDGAGHVREIIGDALKSGWTGPLTLEPHVSYSKAVMVTGPSGTTNQAFSTLSAADSFHLAAEAAKKLLLGLGVKLA